MRDTKAKKSPQSLSFGFPSVNTRAEEMRPIRRVVRLAFSEKHISVSNIIMEDALKRIDERLERIESHLGLLEKNLSTHITFIEKTYKVLRAPLNFISNRVNCIMGRSAPQELEDAPHT